MQVSKVESYVFLYRFFLYNLYSLNRRNWKRNTHYLPAHLFHMLKVLVLPRHTPRCKNTKYQPNIISRADSNRQEAKQVAKNHNMLISQ